MSPEIQATAQPATQPATQPASRAGHPAGDGNGAVNGAVPESAASGVEGAQAILDGPNGFVQVTPNDDGATFALDPSKPASGLQVTSDGNLTMTWSQFASEGRVVFELTPAGGPTGWSIFIFQIGLEGVHIPLNDYQEMWSTSVRHEPDQHHVDVRLKRPPTAVLGGEFTDYQFTIGYCDPSGLKVIIDPRMINKGDG